MVPAGLRTRRQAFNHERLNSWSSSTPRLLSHSPLLTLTIFPATQVMPSLESKYGGSVQMQSTLFSGREFSHSSESPEYNREPPASDFQTTFPTLPPLSPSYKEFLANPFSELSRPTVQSPSPTFLLNAPPQHH